MEVSRQTGDWLLERSARDQHGIGQALGVLFRIINDINAISLQKILFDCGNLQFTQLSTQ